MQFTIINRHYPPNPGITGESAWDLAKYLIDNCNAEIHVVHIDKEDEGGGQRREPIGTLHTVKTIYKGKNKFLRLLSGVADGLMLAIKARKVAKGTIICMTSPPLLPLWVSLFFKKWILWSMDLFPEGFAATGTVSPSNFLYRFILKQSYKRPPQQLIVLGEGQGRCLTQKYKKQLPQTVLPCGVLFHGEKDLNIPNWKKDDTKIYFGYCGNLGQAHSDDFLVYFINNLDPQKHTLILAVYGEKSQKIIDLAKDKEGVFVQKQVPRSQLHFIDVHLVSLLNSWTHVAVPSKAVSSVCADASILFCGNKEADTWQMLQEAGWLIEENNLMEAQVANFLKNITQKEVLEKRQKAELLNQKLKTQVVESYQKIKNIL